MMKATALDLQGKWVDILSDCSRAYISVTDNRVADSEISCKIEQSEMSSTMIKTVRGINCQAEGHQLGDFSFHFRVNDNGIIEY